MMVLLERLKSQIEMHSSEEQARFRRDMREKYSAPDPDYEANCRESKTID